MTEFGEHQALANWRVVAYGAAASLIVLAGCLLALATKPGGVEACSRACGDGRLKAWTEVTPAWVEYTKGIENPNISHPPVPEKCECQP